MIDLKNSTFRMLQKWRGKDYRHLRYYDNGYRLDKRKLGLFISNSKAFTKAYYVNELLSKSGLINIIGSGDSLKTYIDKKELFESDSFVMNGSHSIYSGTDKVFSFYIVSDVGFIKRSWGNFVSGIKKSHNLLVDHRVVNQILRQDASVLNEINVYVFDNILRPYGRKVVIEQNSPEDGIYILNGHIFSINTQYGFNPSRTVAYLALQIAVVLGYKQINLWGLDFGGDRFYEEKLLRNSMLEKDFNEYILPDFKLAAKVLLMI